MNGWTPLLAAAHTERDRFARAARAPRSVQIRLLQHILAANKGTEFGRVHGFDRIESIEAFRAQVPIRSYDGLRPWIDRMAGGSANILTADPVVACEETGGSTSGAKLIPYTNASLQAFRAAVLPWLGDLARQRPGTFAGCAYVAMSPVARAMRQTAGGVPIGLPSEGAYLGSALAPAIASVMALPPEVGGINDIDIWRFLTLRFLLAHRELSFISVWSPTFLLGLLEALTAFAEPLMRAVRDGAIGVPDLPFEAPALAPDPDRARLIGYALARAPVGTPLIWPRLATVSAWADGASKSYAQHLQEMLPHACLQPKGLLATEGAVSLPWQGSRFPVPALKSTFLEFIDAAGQASICDELREGATYRVIMTAPGGLYRYDLGDCVRCRGYVDGLPRLEFAGRVGVVSDLVGEKLCEDFVVNALSAVDRPACLVACATRAPFYELLVDAVDGENLRPLARQVEEKLHANPQYAYARALGQLGPVRPRAVSRLRDRYIDVEARRGRRLANIKPATLITDPASYLALTTPAEEWHGVPNKISRPIQLRRQKPALVQGAAE
jgi:hypothetical protein